MATKSRPPTTNKERRFTLIVALINYQIRARSEPRIDGGINDRGHYAVKNRSIKKAVARRLGLVRHSAQILGWVAIKNRWLRSRPQLADLS